MEEVVERFATSPVRIAQLRGLLEFRRRLRNTGLFSRAFQWMDGSFVERRPTEPNDIDVVTFYSLVEPETADASRHPDVFAVDTKETFSCDAYLINLDSGDLVDRIVYWYGLFSHRRTSFEWKGLIHLDLVGTNDAEASRLLDQREANEASG